MCAYVCNHGIYSLSASSKLRYCRTFHKLKYSAGRSTGYPNEGYSFHYCGYTKTCAHTHTYIYI